VIRTAEATQRDRRPLRKGAGGGEQNPIGGVPRRADEGP
jgi:hypothetical protein